MVDIIATGRTILRQFRPSDLDDLHAILSDPVVMEYMEPPFDREKTAAFLRDFCIAKRGAVAVEHRDTDRVIGYVLFNDLCQSGVYELVWAFNRAYWRQGYAYEACSALIEHAFSALNAQKVCAETADMLRSAPFMAKLGMRPAQTQQTDLYCCELSRENFHF